MGKTILINNSFLRFFFSKILYFIVNEALFSPFFRVALTKLVNNIWQIGIFHVLIALVKLSCCKISLSCLLFNCLSLFQSMLVSEALIVFKSDRLWLFHSVLTAHTMLSLAGWTNTECELGVMNIRFGR